MEREAESGGKLGDLDSYEIEGGETKGEILQNLAEFQFSCVSVATTLYFLSSIWDRVQFSKHVSPIRVQFSKHVSPILKTCESNSQSMYECKLRLET